MKFWPWLIFLLLLALTIFFIRRHIKHKREKELQATINKKVKSHFKLTNQDHINRLNPAVRPNFAAFIKDIEAMGFVVVITESTRSYAEAVYLKQKNSKNATPGFSSHEYGTALDLVLYKNGKVINKGDAYYQAWVDSGVPKLAKEKYKMRWGGDFPNYKDEVHFDYNNLYDTKKLYAYVIKMYGSLDKVDATQLDLKKVA